MTQFDAGASSAEPEREAFTARVKALRVEAVQAAGAVAGSASACALAKGGRSFPAYKFHEGRVAAFGMLARRLTGSPDPIDLILDELDASWRAEIERRAGSSRDWQAYAAGGLDAVMQCRGAGPNQEW